MAMAMTAAAASPLYRAFMMFWLPPRRTKKVPMTLAMMEAPPSTSGYVTAALKPGKNKCAKSMAATAVTA
jgi:hypothetical protein